MADGINNSGLVVGWYNPSPVPLTSGFTYYGNTFTAPVRYPGDPNVEDSNVTLFRDVNNSGQIVGHHGNPVVAGPYAFQLSGGAYFRACSQRRNTVICIQH